MKTSSQIGRLTAVALAAAFMCVLSPFSFPIGALSMSLGSFCLYLIALLFRPSDAFFAVLLYLTVGFLGLPVFAGFSGGAQMLFGATGGFLLAYPFAALLISSLSGVGRVHSIVWRSISLLLGTLFLYAGGSIGYFAVTGVPLGSAVIAAVLPFVFGDLLKMAAAFLIFSRLSPFLMKKG